MVISLLLIEGSHFQLYPHSPFITTMFIQSRLWVVTPISPMAICNNPFKDLKIILYILQSRLCLKNAGFPSRTPCIFETDFRLGECDKKIWQLAPYKVSYPNDDTCLNVFSIQIFCVFRIFYASRVGQLCSAISRYTDLHSVIHSLFQLRRPNIQGFSKNSQYLPLMGFIHLLLDTAAGYPRKMFILIDRCS